MHSIKSIFAFFLLLIASSQAFVPMSRNTVGPKIVASPIAPTRSGRPESSSLYMGGKQAKFGVFSPAVYGAKIVLGNDRLLKIRGKAIALHSEKIGDFCTWIGAYHLRTKLIKKAKLNGDILGFLV